MRFHEVRQCDEFCPFYNKRYYPSSFDRSITITEYCELLGFDYNDPKQVLVKLWAKRRREVEGSYRHVRIVDRPDIDKVFPPVPDFCPIKDKPVVVMLQRDQWKPWEGKSSLCDHYGDSPVGRIKKRLQEEKAQKQREREQRCLEREMKKKEKENKRLTKADKPPSA